MLTVLAPCCSASSAAVQWYPCISGQACWRCHRAGASHLQQIKSKNKREPARQQPQTAPSSSSSLPWPVMKARYGIVIRSNAISRYVVNHCWPEAVYMSTEEEGGGSYAKSRSLGCWHHHAGGSLTSRWDVSITAYLDDTPQKTWYNDLCWFHVGPTSQTVGQHCTNMGSRSPAWCALLCSYCLLVMNGSAAVQMQNAVTANLKVKSYCISHWNGV